MQPKISKTLEGIIARSAFHTTKAGMTHSLKDFLTLELLREEGSLAYQLLSSRLKDWELYQVRLRIEREVISAKQQETRSPEEYYRDFTEELLVMPGVARSVSTAHALLAIISDRSTATARVLEMYGVTADSVSGDLQKFAVGDDFRTEVQVHMLDFGEENRNEEKGPAHLLDKFGVNLTRLAREGKIDPVIGREQEIERVVQILSRRKKNNPILIGEAGVGKSAIVEGLALRIARGEVPYTIADKTLFSLDVSSLVAGTKFRGEFEERMQQLLDELRKAKDTIIFIDEIHTIVGAGSTQGSLDTANILKPALARGELQTIGATTLDEYRENIETDSALERRFQKVVIEPTTPEQTLQILRNIAPHYERHHKVHYTEEALQACVTLTGRYVTDRYFPDKAIDALDEAGSRAHLQSAREPEELRAMKTALSDAKRERREAVEALVYEKAASARMREIALRSKLGESRAEWKRSLESNPVEITARHIQEVITAMTGIPAERVSDGEMIRLQTLREHLAKRVVGQQEAVEKISRTIRRSRAGLKDENRPIGVFLFVGPTGVGKTLLAKAVAGEASVPFFSISGSDFVEMFVGVGASRVRDLFAEASKVAPCIIFIDEIDTIGKSRDGGRYGGGNDEREQTLNQLLAEMDGFDPSKGVIVLAATNRPEVLDKALLRPGRFDRRITVDRPNLAGRLATLQVHTRGIKLAEDVDLKKVALATAGCVGADLANLANEAALRAVRKGRKLVTQEDMLAAFEFVIAGSEKKGSVLTEFEKKLVAYHEVGHAMVAYKQKNAEPVQKITIVPHTEGSLGYTLLMPEEDKTNLRTRDELMAKIAVSMGGRAAEEVVMNTMTNGASQDIQEATSIARNMVAMYGMSDAVGMVALGSVRNQYLDGGYAYSETGLPHKPRISRNCY